MSPHDFFDLSIAEYNALAFFYSETRWKLLAYQGYWAGAAGALARAGTLPPFNQLWADSKISEEDEAEGPQDPQDWADCGMKPPPE